MSYQVPQNIDENKIFIVNRSEIEGRLDPHFNRPSYSCIWHQLSNQNYEFSTLKKNSVLLFSGITPKSGGDAYAEKNGVPFIRSGDFSDTNLIEFSQLLQIKKDVHCGLMRNSQLKKGDLLFAIVGATIGKVGVFLYETEANINQAICAVRLKETLNPFYVQAFFQTSIGQKIIERVKRPVARANINIEEVGNLPIPMLNVYRQMEIVRVMEEARVKKQEIEQQAENILSSIDDYLLGELGIELPETKIQSLQDRIFTVSISEVRDGRMDPKSVLYLGEHAKSETFENVPLKQIAGIEKGDSITSADVNKEGKYPVIAGGQTSPYNHDKYNYKGDVVTVSASGAYSGYVWYHKGPIFASDCSVIYSKNSQFLTQYIFEVLKAQQSQIYLLQQGAGQPHVYPNDLGKLWIPVVPLIKQQEIVEHIMAIRQRAKILQEEGNALLVEAKQKIEKLILE